MLNCLAALFKTAQAQDTLPPPYSRPFPARSSNPPPYSPISPKAPSKTEVFNNGHEKPARVRFEYTSHSLSYTFGSGGLHDLNFVESSNRALTRVLESGASLTDFIPIHGRYWAGTFSGPEESRWIIWVDKERVVQLGEMHAGRRMRATGYIQRVQ